VVSWSGVWLQKAAAMEISVAQWATSHGKDFAFGRKYDEKIKANGLENDLRAMRTGSTCEVVFG